MSPTMKFSIFAVVTLFSIKAVFASGGDSSLSTESQFSVFGYLPEWRYAGANFDTIFSHVSHLALFSVEPDPRGNGDIIGLDRLPSGEAFDDVRVAALRHGKSIILCFGGNGRSSGFTAVSTNATVRTKFIANVVELVKQYHAHGVDYNWEYPGYDFVTGYTGDPKKLRADWDGLRDLVIETKKALGDRGIVTLAYYPDGVQEREMKSRQLDKHADLLHAMTYDQSGKQHSPMKLAEDAILNAKKAGLDLQKITLGLPFYGRDDRSGDWVTYEDIIGKPERFAPTDTGNTVFDREDNRHIGFNSARMINAKVKLAISQGLGGVMIWESGQDCRIYPVTRDGTTHQRTCPGPPPSSLEDPNDDDSSLHAAITRAAKEAFQAKRNRVHFTNEEDYEPDL